jgi:uncharacterized protein with HEPN domain
MTTERVYIDYLEDILEALEKGLQFTKGMDFEHFREDDKTTFAVKGSSLLLTFGAIYNKENRCLDH